jgi:hypothetical protein
MSTDHEADATMHRDNDGKAELAAPDIAPPVGLLAGQPAAVIGSIVAIIDAVLVAAVPLPEWLTSVLVAVVTVAGALGIRSKVTPVARPRLDA